VPVGLARELTGGGPAIASTLDRARAYAPALGTAVATAVLSARIVPDVGRKPIHEDEALAGLVAADPLPEMIVTVIQDRGGAPLHFILAHLSLSIDASAAALRSPSVLFALATVVVTFDLGRRLFGSSAGVTAAALVATSQMLGIYGSFGRMYALFALAGAVAADLFVRALERRTASAAAVAALGAYLLPASHPYGAIVVLAEGLVALAVWRGRPFRAALPVAAIALAMAPFLYADRQLAGRFDVGVTGERSLAGPEHAAGLLVYAVGGLAGGRGPIFFLFAVAAGVGLVALARRSPAYAAFTCLALAGPSLLLLLARSPSGIPRQLQTRHLIYALPLWTVLVAAGIALMIRYLPPFARPAAVAVAVALAVVAPEAAPDPRDAEAATPAALAAPAAWLEGRVAEGDVIFPHSPAFLAALGTTRHATPLPRGHPAVLLPALERAKLPVSSAFAAVPIPERVVDAYGLRDTLGRRYVVQVSEEWVLIQARGPFADEPSILRALVRALAATRRVADHPPRSVRGYLFQGTSTLCAALRVLGDPCPPRGVRDRT
jgi:hypothetical protein